MRHHEISTCTLILHLAKLIKNSKLIRTFGEVTPRVTRMEKAREDVSQLFSSLRKIDSDKITERKVRYRQGDTTFNH